MNKAKNTDFPTRSDTNNLAKTILDTTGILSKRGIDCWLCYGALLGMVRENRLLPWNNDAELGCWYVDGINNKFKIVAKELIRLGYNVYYYSTIGTLSVKAAGADLNINCFWREDGYATRPYEPLSKGQVAVTTKVLYYVALAAGIYPIGFAGKPFSKMKSPKQLGKTLLISILRLLPKSLRKNISVYCYSKVGKAGVMFGKTAIPAVFFDTLKSIPFYQGRVLIPKESEKLVEHIYGSEWRTPKDKWRFYSDENKNKTQILFVYKIWPYKKMDII